MFVFSGILHWEIVSADTQKELIKKPKNGIQIQNMLMLSVIEKVCYREKTITKTSWAEATISEKQKIIPTNDLKYPKKSEIVNEDKQTQKKTSKKSQANAKQNRIGQQQNNEKHAIDGQLSYHLKWILLKISFRMKNRIVSTQHTCNSLLLRGQYHTPNGVCVTTYGHDSNPTARRSSSTSHCFHTFLLADVDARVGIVSRISISRATEAESFY